ncbi:MAG: ATP-binding protein [Planctomycetota bacterium]
MSLTGKLVLGFLFALVLQIAQIVVSNMITGRLQEASVLVAETLTATVSAQNGVEALAQLSARARSGQREPDKVDAGVLRVYVEELSSLVQAVVEKAPAEARARVRQLQGSAQALVAQFRQVERAIGGPSTEHTVDGLEFLDDAAQDLDQEFHRLQVELRTRAEDVVRHEQALRDLPLKASVSIAGVGVLIMAAFVAWFSRQLVIPIRRAWSELEGRVAERTRELAQTVDQLECEIHERKRAEAQKDELHHQLVDASRRAGMAELANGVLHNVGNVLNSVNVSADVLRRHLRESRFEGIGRVAALLSDHEADLVGFFGSPPGRALPAYLQQLAGHLDGEKSLLVDEVAELSSRIDHIKQIVDRQQTYARSGGVHAMTKLADLVLEVADMHRRPMQQAGITVEVTADGDDRAEIDRGRVHQILMNVIGNARQAIRETGRDAGHIGVQIARRGDRMHLRVHDDGVGIAAGDLERIFGHGFTTKPDGHGFGLHHSANAAAEMGGRLWAESEGLGHGATFVLELPAHEPLEVAP